jgi:hypothetical protein
VYNVSIIKSFYVESRQHQNSALIATSDTLTPQWIIQTKDVTKINLSSVEYLIGLCVSPPTIRPLGVVLKTYGTVMRMSHVDGRGSTNL